MDWEVFFEVLQDLCRLIRTELVIVDDHAIIHHDREDKTDQGSNHPDGQGMILVVIHKECSH